MKKDLIIARWFENKNMTTENTTFGDVVPMVHLPASSNNYFLLYRVAPGHNNFLSLSFQVM